MAGVGFELKKLFTARTAAGHIKAYTYSAIITTGPFALLTGMAGGGPNRWWIARNLRHLVDPRVREGLITLDDLPGSLGYVRKGLRRGRRT